MLVLKGISWFEEWFAAFRIFVAWLRDRAHIIMLKVALEKVYPELALKVFGPTSPFKLRWGTVYHVAADVLELIGQIQAAAMSERGIELDTEVQVMGQDEAI